MSFSSETLRKDFLGDGVETVYTFSGMDVKDEDHLTVYVDEVETSAYTVDLLTQEITFDTAPAADAPIVILFNIPFDQTVEYNPSTRFPFDSHENAMDKAANRDKQLKEITNRSLRVPEFVTDFETQLTNITAGNALVVNDDATGIDFMPLSGSTTVDIHDLTAIGTFNDLDEFVVYDESAGLNRKVTLGDLKSEIGTGTFTGGDGITITGDDIAVDLANNGGLEFEIGELRVVTDVLAATTTDSSGSVVVDYSGVTALSGSLATGDLFLLSDVSAITASKLRTITVANLRTGLASGINLDELADVVITAPAADQVLKYNGSQWINDADAGGSSYTASDGIQLDVSDFKLALNGLTDITTSTATGDFFPLYDLSASNHKKVSAANLAAFVLAQTASAINITGGSITGITDLAVADGGTGASTAANARTNLGAAASGTNTDITSIYLDNTGLKIKDTNASHGLIISPGSNITADRTLTITTGDSNRTLTMSGDSTISGTNTGDQTITLTGNVTGSGTGSFATTIATSALTGLTEDTTPDSAADFIKTYDASAGTYKKVLLSNLPSSGSGAPTNATYVTLSTNGTLTNERVLTGTANQVDVVDNGAGSTVVLSLPQSIAPTSAVSFGSVTTDGVNVMLKGSSSLSNSAGTINLASATGNYVPLTGGVTTVTSFGTVAVGAQFWIQCNGTFTITHNASSLYIPGGADLNVIADDVVVVRSAGSGNWRVIGKFSASTTNPYIPGGTDVAVADGGSGRSSATAYAVICGGTTSTGAHQSIASVGTAAQVLTSNGAGALPTFQDLPGGSSAATQAEQETGSSTSVFVSPGRQQYHASASKFWIKFNGTGTPSNDASYNVTSITDHGVGDYTLNFTTSFSSANYCVVGNTSSKQATTEANGVVAITTLATGSVRIYVETGGDPSVNNAGFDSTIVCVAGFGDQ